MKRIGIVLALTFIMSLALTSCASLFLSKWDSKTPKDQMATLVYHEGITIGKIDGQEKKTGPLVTSYPGKGSPKRPKAALKIPAGERTISAKTNEAGLGTGTNYKDATYTFLPGHTYQMNVTMDSDAVAAGASESGSVGGFMASAGSAMVSGDVPLKFEFIDITKTK